MPVEFFSGAEAAAFGRFDGDLSREDLDRVFFLDDADLELIGSRRGDHNRLGFALQLGTVRWLGAFLSDPTAVPPSVVGYVAGQLEVSDPVCVGRYLERRRTRFEHAAKIKAACGLREFAQSQRDFELWLDARAWMTGDGPRAVLSEAVGWLRERDVLLPGVTTLARLVARARTKTDERLWQALAGAASAEQARVVDLLLEVSEGGWVSGLERWRKGPAEPTGKSLKVALSRVAEIHGVGIDTAAVRALVPARRLVDVARYGMAAKAPALRRHPAARRLATLVATVVHLSASSIDDCLELFDLLMVTELLGKAQRETEKQRAAQHPRLARASAKLAAAVRVLLEASPSGEPVQVAEVWRSIEAGSSARRAWRGGRDGAGAGPERRRGR